MSADPDLLARIEAEHGPEIAEVVRRAIEAGPPKRKSRRIYDGNPDPRRTGHALGNAAGKGRHSSGTASSVAVRDMPAR